MSTGHRNIFVFVEAYDDVPTKPAKVVIGKGRQLADELGCYVEAIYPFNDEQTASDIIQLGVDVCHQSRASMPRSSWDALLCETIPILKPEFLILPSSPACNALAGVVAGTKNFALLLNCKSLGIETTSRTFKGEIDLFRDFQASLATEKTEPQVATFSSENIPEPFPDHYRNGRIRKLEHSYPSGAPITTIEKIPLSLVKHKQKTVILVGPTISKEDDCRLIETFASAINAPIVTSENFAKEEKILLFFSEAKLMLAIELGYDPGIFFRIPPGCRIITINRDKDAQIANTANISIHGDFRKVIPSLLERWTRERS